MLNIQQFVSGFNIFKILMRNFCTTDTFFGFNEFGYKIEYVKDYSGSPILKGRGLPDIDIVKNFGFNVGLIGDMRINKFLNLRFEPGLYYSQRDFVYPKSNRWTCYR